MKRAGYLLIFLCTACIDRIIFDVNTPVLFPITVEGYISTGPGPYTVKISKAFDIESKQSIKAPISVKRVVMEDNLGNSEQLMKISDGEYQTNPSGIRGVEGRSYALEIETLDGRIYRSTHDPILPAGSISSVSAQYQPINDKNGATQYGFDIYVNSIVGEQSNSNFLWKFVGTFQVETNPELFTVPCGESRCAAPLPCSSFIEVNGQLIFSQPCSCCTCWSKIFNDEPIVSDNQVVKDGSFVNLKIARVPITRWTFMNKVHAEVQQFSLSPGAFAFWKAIKDQKQAIGSLFQPQEGKIPTNFIQISGNTGPIVGFFYGTSIVSKSIYITRNDIPNPSVIPASDPPFADNCERLFPFTTSIKPSFWID